MPQYYTHIHIQLRKQDDDRLKRIMAHMETGSKTAAIRHALQLAEMVIDDEVIVTMPKEDEDNE